jgi:hypothetical protein
LCTRNLIFFSHSPRPFPPGITTSWWTDTKIEISTTHRSARKTGSSELWRNLHVKIQSRSPRTGTALGTRLVRIRSTAFGSNNCKFPGLKKLAIPHTRQELMLVKLILPHKNLFYFRRKQTYCSLSRVHFKCNMPKIFGVSVENYNTIYS